MKRSFARSSLQGQLVHEVDRSNCKLFGNSDSINNLGPYWINNNLWGAGSGLGSQCSWDNSISGSNLSWGTSWSWSGQTNSFLIV